MRILLAEDDDALKAVLRRTLVGMGHEVVVAGDGLEAWGMLQVAHAPVVLSDWMMPGLDGPSLCRRVRGLRDASYTYFILLTGRDGRDDRMEGLRAGADDFLAKPVDVEELAIRLEVARRILSVQDRLERQNSRLTEIASTDELTGLANRREFDRSLDASFALAARQGQPLSLVLADIDHFKQLNDTFGHPAGDAALRGFAEALRSTCRDHEPIARCGGEEFGVLLFGADEGASLAIAERIRAGVAAHDWPHRPLTASFGVSTCDPGVGDVAELMERADAALYHSKRAGRNRATHFSNLSVAPSRVPAGPH